MTFVESIKAQGVTVEGEFDIQKLFDVWGLVLSRQYGVQVKIWGIPKDKEVKDGEKRKETSGAEIPERV